MSRARSGAARAIADAAPVFAALGDETRLRLVTKLCNEGPQSIARLSVGEGMTRQAITKHLRGLADAGLVRDHARGRERIWELAPKPLDDALRYLDHISAQWDAAITRLKSLVEDGEGGR